MAPYISIIICTRNRSHALRETLAHYRQLRFDGEWELVLVDNLSTDDTSLVIAEIMTWGLPLHPTRCNKIGLGAAREHGRRQAKGSILLFTDDDCYPESDLLEAYRTVFSESPSLGYCGGRILLWDETDIKMTVDYRETPVEILPYRFIAAGDLQGANLAIKAEVLQAIGGVDENLGAGTNFPCEDIDMIARAAYAGYSGRFDPRPVIYHHHQRKEKHRATILKSYDRGRGAYYMKLLLRPDTRLDCGKIWYWAWRKSIRDTISTRSFQSIWPRLTEMTSACRYLVFVLLRRIRHTNVSSE